MVLTFEFLDKILVLSSVVLFFVSYDQGNEKYVCGCACCRFARVKFQIFFSLVLEQSSKQND